MLFILAMKIFSETVAYACRFVLRLRDRSDDREVAREIEAEVGKRVASKKGSALSFRNLYLKKLSFLLCNVATLQHRNVATSRRWKLIFE